MLAGYASVAHKFLEIVGYTGEILQNILENGNLEFFSDLWSSEQTLEYFFYIIVNLYRAV